MSLETGPGGTAPRFDGEARDQVPASRNWRKLLRALLAGIIGSVLAGAASGIAISLLRHRGLSHLAQDVRFGAGLSILVGIPSSVMFAGIIVVTERGWRAGATPRQLQVTRLVAGGLLGAVGMALVWHGMLESRMEGAMYAWGAAIGMSGALAAIQSWS